MILTVGSKDPRFHRRPGSSSKSNRTCIFCMAEDLVAHRHVFCCAPLRDAETETTDGDGDSSDEEVAYIELKTDMLKCKSCSLRVHWRCYRTLIIKTQVCLTRRHMQYCSVIVTEMSCLLFAAAGRLAMSLVHVFGKTTEYSFSTGCRVKEKDAC